MANFLPLIIVATIAVILLAIKTNAALVFFALCAGNALVQFASKNMAYVHGHLNTHLLPSNFTITSSTILIIILFVPAVLVAVLAKHNMGPAKYPIQIFPAIATGILSVLFVVPLLSISMQNSITNNKFWSLMEKYQIPIVGLCVIVSLLILIMETYSHGHSSKHHHKP